MPDEPRHAVRAHDGKRRIEPARSERPHLVERPLPHHGAKAGLDARAQRRAVRAHENFCERDARERAGPALAPKGRERTAGRLQHFERAQDAQPIVRAEVLGCLGIAPESAA